MAAVKAGPKGKVTAPSLDLTWLPPSGGARVAAFAWEFLRVPRGHGALDRLHLRPWQTDLVETVFGENRPRQALWSLPRGNGKTALAAVLALYACIADGVEGAQV